jgi:phosphatidylglycerol:prolipoprotein diacylglycerol transferase
MVLFIKNTNRSCKLAVFSVLLALGTTLGLTWVTLESPKAEREMSLNAGVITLLGAIMGARAAYVAVHWAYYQEHLIETLQLWLGGFSWPGALIGGGLGILIASRLFVIPFGNLADRLLPLLATLSVASWLGCWFTGCAYGPEVMWGLPTKDEWGIWQPRLPLQLINAVLTVLLFWGIEQVWRRKNSMPPGLAANLGFAGLSLILLATSFLREDPYPLYNGLRLETWAAMFFFGLSIIFGVVIVSMNKR